MNYVDRFMSKVRIDKNGCWIWTASKWKKGYGRFASVDGMCTSAHRVSYELFVGKIPDGKQIDHLCMNKACVNPKHLEAVTQAENLRRFNATRTKCKRGHDLSGDNLYRSNYGRRICKTCTREYQRVYYKNIREANVRN